jgi:GH25 family lysozyme M1 (1,4-beta-N-acetylmuramidase)
MKGIDISAYQGNNIDFKKVKESGIEIVYIKATEGITFHSPGFKLQYEQAKSAGLKIGFYHYMRANDAASEAKHFIKATEGFKVDCKYVIDIEEMEGRTVSKISSSVRMFADYMISQGKEVCIYTSDSFYDNNLNSTVKDIPIWIAHYGVVKPNITRYAGFQYTSKGNVYGVSGNVDMNEFNEGIFLGINVVSKVILMANPVARDNEFIKRLQEELNKQYNSKLDVDGIVGELTFSACPTVRVNARGNITRLLQEKLHITIDGVFGKLTLNAVKAFQNKYRLTPDGVVGKNTWVALLR